MFQTCVDPVLAMLGDVLTIMYHVLSMNLSCLDMFDNVWMHHASMHTSMHVCMQTCIDTSMDACVMCGCMRMH